MSCMWRFSDNPWLSYIVYRPLGIYSIKEVLFTLIDLVSYYYRNCMSFLLSIYLSCLLTRVVQDGLEECLYPLEIVCWCLSLGILTLTIHSSGPRFRKHRRFINQVFNQKGISTFRPLQEKGTLDLLEGMLHHPDDFVDHFRRFVTFTLDRQI